MITETQPTATIAHPVWCQATNRRDWPLLPVDEDSGDIIAPEDRHSEHAGLTLSLDCGESFAWTVTTQLRQMYDITPDGVDESEPHVRLGVRDNELIQAEATAYLTKAEVERLIEMLQRVTQIL